MAGGSQSVVVKALVANFGIAIAKFVAASISRSSSMLSEAVHSLADAGNQLFLLLGMRRAQRKEDAVHEFGYAAERYFWAFIVAVSLFTVGATFGGLFMSQITGNGVWDGVGSIIVGVTLFGVAFFLARKTKQLLIGQSVPPGQRLRIVEIVEQSSGVRSSSTCGRCTWVPRRSCSA